MEVGSRIECYYDDGWYPGLIETCNKDGTFYVRFDDGDVLEDAIAEEIRLLPNQNSNIPTNSSSSSSSNPYYGNNNTKVNNINVNTDENTSSSGRNYGDVLAVFMPMKVDQGGNSYNNNNGEQVIMQDDADTKVILTQVELFLLPDHDDRYFIKHNHNGLGLDKGDIPIYRLEHVLSQASVLEHIRTMQTLYRDSEDEMRLEPEFRIGEANQRLPTRLLVEKLCIQRARAIGLCSLCHGEDSLATLRAHIELSNAYALQGLWPQVSEQMKICSQKLLSISAIRRADASKIATSRAKAFLISKLVSRLFRILRGRAASNGGQIALGVTSQIVQEMEEIISISKVKSLKSELKIDILDLATSLKRFQESSIIISSESNPNSNATSGEIEPSWGRVLSFLRSKDCEVMDKWMNLIKSATLPQHIAVLGVAFQLADPLNKGVAHPRELSKALQHCPASIRIFGVDAVVQSLYEIETEVPLAVVRNNGHVDRILSKQLGTLGEENTLENSGRRTVTYELPVSWDEVLASYVINAEDDPFETLRIQVLTMLGVCQMFTGHLDEAETNLKEAIKHTSRVGLDESAVTCELYNSIAQLMIMKHREWHADKKNRCREEAAAWLSTPEGRKELQDEVLSIMQSSGQNVDTQGNPTVIPVKTKPSSGPRQPAPTREEAKVQAKTMLIRARARHIARQESDPTLPSVEAAFRYLTKTFDLLSKTHGSHHSAIGASCLAVASVQNMVDALEGTEEWLRRALTTMQALKPVPVRALSFTRIQLSQVLSRQGRVEEALEVLIMAFDFHLEQVRRGLQIRSNNTFSPSLPPQSSPSPLPLASPASTTLTQDSYNNPNPHSRSQMNSPASRSRPVGPESPTTHNHHNHNLSQKNNNRGAFPVGKDGGPNIHAYPNPNNLGREHAPLPHPSDPRGVSAKIAARYNPSEISRALPLRAGRLLYEDIVLTLELGDRLTEMRLRVQGPHPAVDQAERTADLAEHAYGWDSPEAVKYRRHVGERCANAADWQRAVQNLTKSLEGHEMLYGAKDKRTNQVRELLHHALNQMDGGRAPHERNTGGGRRKERPQSAGPLRR